MCQNTTGIAPTAEAGNQVQHQTGFLSPTRASSGGGSESESGDLSSLNLFSKGHVLVA